MGDVLASLVAQANAEGADILTLRALIEEAVERGVRRASGMSAGTAETRSGSGLQPASPVGNAETPKPPSE